MRTDIFGFNNPQVRIFDHRGRLIVNSGDIQLGYEMTEFEYSYDEGDKGDSGKISFQFNGVSYMDHFIFSTQTSIYVSWGYPGFMCPPLRVWVLDITFTYNAKGLFAVIDITNNLALFNKNKNPILIKAKELLEYSNKLKNLQIETQKVEGDVIYNGGAYFKTKRNNRVDSTDQPYKLGVSLSSPTITPSQERESLVQHFNGLLGPKSIKLEQYTERDLIKLELEYDKVRGGFSKLPFVKVYPNVALNTDNPTTSYYTHFKSSEINGVIGEVFGMDGNTEGFGNSPKEAMKNLMGNSDYGPYTVTSNAGNIVIHNKKLLGNTQWVYKLQSEGGDLLAFVHSTNNKYTNKTLASSLSIDPRTGTLSLTSYAKAIMEATSPDRKSPEADQEFEFRKRGIDWFLGKLQGNQEILPNEMYHENLKNNFNDWVDLDGVLHTARDNTAVILPHVMIPQAASEVLDKAANNIIKNLQKNEEKIKSTFQILGNPLFTCSIKVLFDGLANRHSGKYYVTKATHKITRDGGYVVDGECYFLYPAEGVMAVKSTIKLDEAKSNIKSTNKISKTIVIAGGLIEKTDGTNLRTPDGIDLTVQYLLPNNQLKFATINISANKYKEIKDDIIKYGKENISFLYRAAGSNYQIHNFEFIYGNKRPEIRVPQLEDFGNELLENTIDLISGNSLEKISGGLQ